MLEQEEAIAERKFRVNLGTTLGVAATVVVSAAVVVHVLLFADLKAARACINKRALSAAAGV